MSWSIRIIILYTGFVALILTLVFTCIGHASELESPDYYARELKFQEQLDASGNAERLGTPIRYVVRERSVQLFLPPEVVSPGLIGTVSFIRPSDSSRDKAVAIQVDDAGVQMIDPGLMSGVYKMRIAFKSMGRAYFKEAVINFK